MFWEQKERMILKPITQYTYIVTEGVDLSQQGGCECIESRILLDFTPNMGILLR